MNNTASRFSRFHASALMHLRTLTLVHFFLLALVSTADTQGPYTYEIIDDQATTTDFDTAYSGPLRKTPFWTMSREELLDSLMKQPTLGLLHHYFGDVCSLLQVVQRTSGHLNHLENHPYECLVFSQVLRFQRYHLALHSLFNRDEQRIMACFDGVHPILKALFELMIEARMVAAYSNVFGENPERMRDLTQRVLVFADLNKKKDNYKFKYLDIPLSADLKSEGLRQEQARTRKECEDRMNALVAKLGQERWKDCLHWFPTKAQNGNPIEALAKPPGRCA